MPIASSVIEEIGVQHDGRRWVREHHTDHTGALWVRNYLAGADDDLNAALAAYATQLGTDLTAAEIGRNIANVLADGSAAQTSTVHSTAAQNFAALRDAYSTATRTQAIMAGDFLGSLADAQLRTAFGMTAAQVTNLRANKLTPATNAAATIRATTGA